MLQLTRPAREVMLAVYRAYRYCRGLNLSVIRYLVFHCFFILAALFCLFFAFFLPFFVASWQGDPASPMPSASGSNNASAQKSWMHHGHRCQVIVSPVVVLSMCAGMPQVVFCCGKKRKIYSRRFSRGGCSAGRGIYRDIHSFVAWFLSTS